MVGVTATLFHLRRRRSKWRCRVSERRRGKQGETGAVRRGVAGRGGGGFGAEACMEADRGHGTFVLKNGAIGCAVWSGMLRGSRVGVVHVRLHPYISLLYMKGLCVEKDFICKCVRTC